MPEFCNIACCVFSFVLSWRFKYIKSLNNSSLHIGIYCLFKTIDIYTTHSYLDLIFRFSMFWTNMSGRHDTTRQCFTLVKVFLLGVTGLTSMHNYLASFNGWNTPPPPKEPPKETNKTQLLILFVLQDLSNDHFFLWSCCMVLSICGHYSDYLLPSALGEESQTFWLSPTEKNRCHIHGKKLRGSWLILLVHEHFMSSEGVFLTYPKFDG